MTKSKVQKAKINTINSFGFEWNYHINNKIEKNTLFGRSKKDDLKYFFEATSLKQENLKGKVILDAGCGSGMLTYEISRFKPKMVYGIDIHSAIDQVKERYKNILNLKILKADIYKLPFKPKTVDVVWCNGVIHHTHDPYLAFKKLAEVVKHCGILYIWVYEKRFSPYKFVKDMFRYIRSDQLPYPFLFKICQIFSTVSVFIHSIYKLITIPLYPYLKNSKYYIKTIKGRSYEEFLMTWFDALSPKYDFRFTREEVSEWFYKNGFTNLKLYWDQVGICGEKNEYSASH